MQNTLVLRDYRDTDSASWLECRLLSFFHMQYYDDVAIERPRFDLPAVQLVATDDDLVVGLMDLEISDTKATIDVLAVRPGYDRRGIASGLLRKGIERLRAHDVESVDAWTRDDVSANQWYQACGFVEAYSYLHVYKTYRDGDAGFATPDGLSTPVIAFMHSTHEHEAAMRERFQRVYACRRYLLTL